MAAEDFDYKNFALSMKQQAVKILHDDISDENKYYITSTLYDFVFMGGEALCNDKTIDFSSVDKIFICQIIAEWTFHKGVDLAHSAVPKEHWNSILQKIAFTIFEVAKQGIIREIEQQELLCTIEQYVVEAWEESFDELSKKNIISDSDAQIAKELSNIDTMAGDISAAQNEKVAKLEKIYNSKAANKIVVKTWLIPEKFGKIKTILVDFINRSRNLFIITLSTGMCILLLCIIYLYLDYINVLSIIAENKIFMYILFNIILIACCAAIWVKITKKNIQKQYFKIETLKEKIQELSNPKSMYDRLKVDTITLTIGTGLLQISDLDQEGELLPKITAMRQNLTDELGYIIPQIRIIDSKGLDEYEYAISIRENQVANGYVYPGKYMVIADQWDSFNEHIPEDAIVGVDPTYQTQAYWISRSDAAASKKLAAVDSCDVIQTHLKEVLIAHVEDIISLDEVQKLINYVNKKEPRFYKDIRSNGLTDYDLKKIFINLIREKVSIKDILFVFEKLCEYSKFSDDYIVLSERLRAAFGRQICLKNADKDRVLLTVSLSPDWEETLDDSIQKTELGTMFLLEPDKVQDLVKTTASTLMKAHQVTGEQPVILCSPRIRLPLYQLLVRHIPTIVVISYSELITDIKVENTYTIGEEL